MRSIYFLPVLLNLRTAFSAAVDSSAYVPYLHPRFAQASVSTDGQCGASFKNAICTGSTAGDCCSQKGFCGSTPAHCQEGCQTKYGTCDVSDGEQSTSTSGNCGISGGFNLTCVGSEWGNCCSSGGFCGKTDAYCGDGCNSLFGNCGSGANNPSTKPSTSKPAASNPSSVSSNAAAQSSSSTQVAPPPVSPSLVTLSTSSQAQQATEQTSNVPSPTASSNTATSSSTSLPSSTIPSSSAQTSTPPVRADPSAPPGLSTGAKAGVAVGVVAVIVALLAILGFLLRRRRNNKGDPPQYAAEFYDHKSTAKLEQSRTNFHEMDTVKSASKSAVELPTPFSAKEEAAAAERARVARVDDRAAAGYDGAYRGN